MKYGMILMAGDPETYCKMAEAAEAAGWDAVFLPDGIAIQGFDGQPFPLFDPWVLFGAIASRTTRIQMGTMIAAVPRRRPWKLARETGTIDHLSNGRLILAAGLGAAADDGGFSKVGEPMDLRTRAELMDECLDILRGLWTGKPFSYAGRHYHIDNMTMVPPSFQQPHIKTWVVGVWPKMKSMNRTLRWDGVIVQKHGATPGTPADPADIRAIRALANENRDPSTPYDIIVGGTTAGRGRKKLHHIRSLADAGATWWLEEVWAAKNTRAVFKRIEEGPPRI